MKAIPPEIRFWKKVDKNGSVPKHVPELGKCWIWTGSKRTHGHGHFFVKGIGASAHRFSYHLHFGEIQNGLCVLHKCDNGSCVNPKHLFLGTHLENMQDASNKGRVPKGEYHSASKLSRSDVIEIRRLYNSENIRITEIVKRFPVNRGCISKIVHGLRWTSVK